MSSQLFFSVLFESSLVKFRTECLASLNSLSHVWKPFWSILAPWGPKAWSSRSSNSPKGANLHLAQRHPHKAFMPGLAHRHPSHALVTTLFGVRAQPSVQRCWLSALVPKFENFPIFSSRKVLHQRPCTLKVDRCCMRLSTSNVRDLGLTNLWSNLQRLAKRHWESALVLEVFPFL